MKEWTKKQKMLLAVGFLAVLTVIGVAAAVLNRKTTQEGMKNFQVEVISERDNYSKITECSSEEEFLGAFMRTFEGCEWKDSEHGTYITGFEGMSEDFSEKYWWCVLVNNESITTGVDEVVLRDGDVYNFILKQGW